MFDWFLSLDPLMQALLGGLLTWGATAVAAALVLVRRDVPRWLLDAMLGFAAGVMVAASVWSLLIPAMEVAEQNGSIAWLPAAIGLVVGAIGLRVVDRYLPHLHLFLPREAAEGVSTTWRRTTLLILAITLHNVPEGLAVGVAFGAAARVMDPALALSLASGAIALAIGIALQNVPEGLAIAMPLRREGFSPLRSFWYGQLSAIVEPIAAVVGAAAVLLVQPILPYALAFAAGAMLFVVVEELIPESQRGEHGDLATGGTILGFTVMMVLDVALG
ncbi:ZIP family metal transporter [Thermomicrobium sp. CFH 73360]|uniref:ZIP family metal transporter n=1 Tax=Thermomicrobium sp. CFH 73360 TaxID=2951987 RepID=UPI002076799F|nr:ZIP family metal transporter [Thermomicrobium sp. CFH 73360]MCM8745665.1 ZIP family metal transporter [Thermomicrobium sp. CFH 73360]